MKKRNRTSRNRRTIKKRTIKKSNYTYYDLYNGDKWDNYRLGDIINGHFICWDKVCSNNEILNKKLLNKACKELEFNIDDIDGNKKWCIKNTDQWADPKDNKLSYIKSIHKNFPNSIASNYVREAGYPKDFRVYDFSILRNIFRKYKYIKPSKSTLVIHLRLGDVLSKKHIKEYTYDIKYYKKLLKKIKNNTRIKQIDIVTGLHKNVYVKKSNDTLNEIIHIFKPYYSVKVILTKDPDKDLYYMCHSKFFANSGGGFSRLITDYVKLDKKNKVYED